MPIDKALLGRRFTCFNCGVKFYDLNKDDAICPKCEADQLDRPKASSKPAASDAPIRPSVRPMAPLLDDDDDRKRGEEEADKEHVGVKKPQTGEDFFDDAESASAESEEES